MRKLYNAFFYVPQYGKVQDRVMMTRVITTVATVVMCLAAMGIAAYAYFSHGVASGSNILKSAKFETKVQIQVGDANGESITVNTSNYQTHIAELKANTEYFITLQHTSGSTAKTGFVIITAEGCNVRYHTQQLGKDGDGNTETITFRLKPDANTKVTFLSHWGTSSYYGYEDDNEKYIRHGKSVTLSIESIDENLPESNTPTPSQEDSGSTTESTTSPAG